MASSLVLFLDLGDLLTKGIAIREDGVEQRFGFPNVVARRLLDRDEADASLLLDARAPLPRLSEFAPEDHPRTRSYPDGEEFLRGVELAPGARVVGWEAAAYGADRELFGLHPSAQNIDALIHKALLLNAEGEGTVDLVLVVDDGPKCEAITRYAQRQDRVVEFCARKFETGEARRLRLDVRCHVLDSALCAAAALPDEISHERTDRLLLIDIGYLRTKVAIIDSSGCVHQESLDGVGVCNCVRRILRDGQEQGLVEDEIAVIRALERSQDRLEVAGRSFDIRGPLEDARRVLGQELAQTIRRIVVRDYEQRGVACQAVAVFGGGSALVGDALGQRLVAENVGFGAYWVTRDTRFLLALGATAVYRS